MLFGVEWGIQNNFSPVRSRFRATSVKRCRAAQFPPGAFCCRWFKCHTPKARLSSCVPFWREGEMAIPILQSRAIFTTNTSSSLCWGQGVAALSNMRFYCWQRGKTRGSVRCGHVGIKSEGWKYFKARLQWHTTQTSMTFAHLWGKHTSICPQMRKVSWDCEQDPPAELTPWCPPSLRIFISSSSSPSLELTSKFLLNI